jgi:tetratricopeptide (TPR) repeat protein
MTFLVNHTSFRRLALAAGVAFLAAIAALSLRGREPTVPASTPDLGSVRAAAGGTLGEITRLQAAVRRAPAAAAPRVALAGEYLQRVRETGDVAFYQRADALLRGVLARSPGNADALVGLGGLALSRHDFRGGLRLARESHAGLSALPTTVDALVELGRYDAARRVLQRLADLKPNLSTYARVSYLRELHGDLAGAASALDLAAAAGGPAPENAAAIEVLRGDLALVRGRPGSARTAYGRALSEAPQYAPAEAGRARLAAYEAGGGAVGLGRAGGNGAVSVADAGTAGGRSKAVGGDAHGRGLGQTIRVYRGLVARLPLPEYAIGLGEAELASGRVRAARQDLALVRVQERLLARAGVNTDTELAVFESDHGSPARGLRLARRAWAAAPSVRSADAVGWALTRSGHPGAGQRWAQRARRLGSADPLLAYHAGMSAQGAQRQRLLRFAFAHGLAARPWQARLAREALR